MFEAIDMARKSSSPSPIVTSATPPDIPPDTPIGELRNFATVSSSWLRAVGVTTYGELCQRDLIELWVELRAHFPHVSRVMYYAMWGAKHGRHWREVPEAEKARFAHLVDGIFDGEPPRKRAARAMTPRAARRARARGNRR
jgi:hypothetical protein